MNWDQYDVTITRKETMKSLSSSYNERKSHSGLAVFPSWVCLHYAFYGIIEKIFIILTILLLYATPDSPVGLNFQGLFPPLSCLLKSGCQPPPLLITHVFANVTF